MRRKYREKSTTSPRPSDSPARPVPAPRAMDRQVILGRVANDRDHVVDRSRPHDAQRPQLVDAGVARVELRENVIAADVALHESAQVFFNSLLVWVHSSRKRNFGLTRRRDDAKMRDELSIRNPQSEIRNRATRFA